LNQLVVITLETFKLFNDHTNQRLFGRLFQIKRARALPSSPIMDDQALDNEMRKAYIF